MAGHSKWKNIQHRKGAQDAKRGKIFTKLAKEITVAARLGGGDLEAETYVEKVYEGYGPGGAAILVECLTDNINRTVADVRHAFIRFSGNLGTEGSVGYMFHKKGTIVYQRSKIKDFDQLLEVALEAGADDVKDESDLVAEIMRVPETYTALDSEKAVSMQKLVDWLEDNEVVQNVYHNAEIPE